MSLRVSTHCALLSTFLHMSGTPVIAQTHPASHAFGALPLLVSEPGLCFEMHPLVLEGLVQTIPPLKAVSSVCPPMKNKTLPHGTLLHFCHLYFVLCSGHSSTHKSLWACPVEQAGSSTVAQQHQEGQFTASCRREAVADNWWINAESKNEINTKCLRKRVMQWSGKAAPGEDI